MRQLLASFPQTIHLSLRANKLERDVREKEANIHALTARVQVIYNYLIVE